MQPTLKTVGMELIHANPYRLLHDYPWCEAKLEALQASIEDVGFWEGVIARPRDEGGYELAFGHHRIEAARRAGMNRAPLIVRDLTDEQMVKFMGRENGEDYKADFLTMLNTWEGAIGFHRDENIDHSAASVARLLGWTRDTTTKGKVYQTQNPVADACDKAYRLIEAGLLDRDDLAGLSVKAVRDLCSPLLSELKTQKRIAEHKAKTEPAEKVEKAEKQMGKAVARGVKQAAKDVREGRVAPSDVGTAARSRMHEQKTQKVSPVPPDFEAVANRMCDTLDRIVSDDAHIEKIGEIVKVIPMLPEGRYRNRVLAVAASLEQLGNRAYDEATKLRQKLDACPAKDVDTPALEVVK